MIGGYVLDAGAVRQLAMQQPYMVTRVVVAVRYGQTLHVPTTALAAGLVGLDVAEPGPREEFEEVLNSPVFGFADLDRGAALTVAELATAAGVNVATAHTAHVALRRPALPVLTDRPAELHKLSPRIQVDELP